ncbi:Phage protein [Sinorhizobium sp. CCBAU 05631]|nr:Phage protein [Sinorhizobium sp. CCBAU 05631]
MGSEPPLDWSNFEGPKRNLNWKPDDQDLIYTAINYRDDEYGDADEDVGQQLVERLLEAWRSTVVGEKLTFDISARLLKEREAARQAHRETLAMTGLTTVAIEDVIAERRRQVEAEGWTPEHDDQHDDFSLAKAASVYAAAAAVGRADRAVMDHRGLQGTPGKLQELWPLSWDISWLKPTSRRRDLIKAAALIIAEIERLDRAEGPADGR